MSDSLLEAKEAIVLLQTGLQSKSQLISKLELDIQKLNVIQVAHSPTDHLESIMSDFVTLPRLAPTKTSADSSIVPILTSQRDRYRQRFEQTQRVSVELSSKVTNLQDQLQRLQQDNVSLYEKIRYQESYNRNSTSIELDSRGREDVSAKYKTQYEDRNDPFKSFRHGESTRAQNLNPADRVAMQITKLLTASKHTRLIFVAYASALHVLVFFALFELMSMSAAK